MLTKNCAICGQEFLALNKNHKYCSDDCRKKGFIIVNKEYNKQYRHSNAYHIYRELYYKRTHKYVVKHCKTCGKQLDNGRQSWCIDCLLDDYTKTKSKEAVLRLASRGYNKAAIMQQLKNRR